MYLDIFLPVIIGLILFGLVGSTESKLDIRQKRRDRGEDLKTYL